MFEDEGQGEDAGAEGDAVAAAVVAVDGAVAVGFQGPYPFHGHLAEVEVGADRVGFGYATVVSRKKYCKASSEYVSNLVACPWFAAQ